jgi:cathepsin D
MTAMDVNVDGERVHGVSGRLARGKHLRDVETVSFAQSDLGEGEVKAIAVRDNVCVGGEGRQACVDMGLLAAVSMEDKPFRSMPSDGIVGLGLQSLAAGPVSSFIGRLFEGSAGVLPQFGIALDGARGELILGGHNSTKLGAPLRWFPVDHPKQGFWQVAIQAVRVGNETVDSCRKGCHGIIDTSVSRLGIQASKWSVLQTALSVMPTGQNPCAGPDLTFDLGGMELTLGPREYAGKDCRPRLGSLDIKEPEFVGVYALGGALLQRYYTAFDWEQQRLGFAPLARAGSSASRGPSGGHVTADEPEGVLMI